MNALEAAINTKFSGTSTLTDAFTGNTRGGGSRAVYWDQADKGAASPYLVLQNLAANSTNSYGGVAYSEPIIRFKSVASGRHTAIANLETLIGVFDEFIPTLSGATCNNATRLGDPVTTMYASENAAGEPEWESVVDYQYSIS